MLLALGFWTWGVTRHARRTRRPPEALELEAGAALGWRTPLILLSVLGAFSVFLYGILRLGWDFDQLSAVFFIMGVVVGLLGRLGVRGTVDAFVEGFRSMTLAALLIEICPRHFGGTRAGQNPRIRSFTGCPPRWRTSHRPSPPSASWRWKPDSRAGPQCRAVRAVLTLPVLVPLSDLIGLSRQVICAGLPVWRRAVRAGYSD